MSFSGTSTIEKPAAAKPSSTPNTTPDDPLAATDSFPRRHLGPNAAESAEMVRVTGFDSLDALIDSTVPAGIRLGQSLDLPEAKGEHETLRELREIGRKNIVHRSFIGAGYHDCITPAVIQRNIMENPGWYTAYTPYQAEIAQGRMEALINFQTMIVDLTGLDIANASLLDEGTAAAEAMAMAWALKKNADARAIFVSENCHPQTIDVVRTRAEPLGIEVIVGDEAHFDFSQKTFAVLLQYPDTRGVIHDYAAFIEKTHAAGAFAIVAADILSLTLIQPPGEFGADIAVGSTQRFGVPLGFGGPHAAYMATRDAFKRQMPGRLVGVSHDAQGSPAYRLSLQTREQHIRRDKATSNICTAQVLLAVMASMYAVYHGPNGLKKIALRIHNLAQTLANGLNRLGYKTGTQPFFDTITVHIDAGHEKFIRQIGLQNLVNFGAIKNNTLTIALDETTSTEDIALIWKIFNAGKDAGFTPDEIANCKSQIANRKSAYLSHPIFNKHHTETEMLRYIRHLESKDLSLCHSMIPLGSCTMKLNATSQMLPVTWYGFSKLHPCAPLDQVEGYLHIFRDLEKWLAEITGFAGISLQPNAGSQGEYAGLLAIRKYHESRGEGHRNVCLIPTSAHGTNPASAVMAGFRVIAVQCESSGDIDLVDLGKKATEHKNDLACLMVTYPSTHGVFEETIREICDIVHKNGGQVYMDGANMNAQVGLCRPGDIGADVCHLNLHKTFCIPHGGGGPGMGPIGVAQHLVPFLPAPAGNGGQVSAAPWGSASILLIPWVYIRSMGAAGLTDATKVAILNANYIARRLENHYPVLYKGNTGLVAHECILDVRQWKPAGIEVEDIAKRLMDYGFHAPTISWPVPGTMMIEPTESESKEELDRFCDAMISIHAEIKAVESGTADPKNNVLKNAPHTARAVISDKWDRPYTREQAAYPAPWTIARKFWPAVGRIDNVYGDRNLVCSCPPIESYSAE